jgi:hypothetical protein
VPRKQVTDGLFNQNAACTHCFLNVPEEVARIGNEYRPTRGGSPAWTLEEGLTSRNVTQDLGLGRVLWKHTKFWGEDLKGRDLSEDLGVDGMIILEWILGK